MIENCSKCNTKIPDERIHLGYRECVECSSVEPYSAHVVYPHKTGAYVQPVTQEQKQNLDRLDRRAVKTSGRLGTTRISGYDTLVKTDTKPEHRKPKRKQQLHTNQVNFQRHQLLSNVLVWLKQNVVWPIFYCHLKLMQHGLEYLHF